MILSQLDLTTVTIVSRTRDSTRAGRTGKIYVPLERVSVYFDDMAAQVRQVIALGVSVEEKSGVRRPHPRHKSVDFRFDIIRGYCPEQRNWGRDGSDWGRYTYLEDCPFSYGDAFDFYASVMALANSEQFNEYQGSGTFYHR